MNQILTPASKDNDTGSDNREVMPDRIVHLLIYIPPEKSAVNVAKVLKGRSAFLFLERRPEIRQSQNWSGHLESSHSRMSTLDKIKTGMPSKNPVR